MAGSNAHWVWRYDYPSPGMGRSVRFGGIQLATNFATQPGFIPFPTPVISGEAVLPSTVDLIVNSFTRLEQDILPGPVSISNLPAVSGEGEHNLMVRDILGRERVITQPYYVSNTLLLEGLKDYSPDIGFTREDFGVESNQYDRFIVAGTYRTGLSNQFTGELRAELLDDQQTAGFGGSYLWPSLGVVSLGVATSRSDLGSGGMLSLGVVRAGGRSAANLSDGLKG